MAVSNLDNNSKAKQRSANPPKNTFPQNLHMILSDQSLSEIISWLPSGKSFVIMRPDLMETIVIPRYFTEGASKSTRYHSFTRKLNRWGFKQITRGPDTGSFSHAKFHRDDPALCLHMVCKTTRKPKASDSAAIQATAAAGAAGRAPLKTAALAMASKPQLVPQQRPLILPPTRNDFTAHGIASRLPPPINPTLLPPLGRVAAPTPAKTLGTAAAILPSSYNALVAQSRSNLDALRAARAKINESIALEESLLAMANLKKQALSEQSNAIAQTNLLLTKLRGSGTAAAFL